MLTSSQQFTFESSSLISYILDIPFKFPIQFFFSFFFLNSEITFSTLYDIYMCI